jgi:hypothetical protein
MGGYRDDGGDPLYAEILPVRVLKKIVSRRVAAVAYVDTLENHTGLMSLDFADFELMLE